MLNKRQHWSIFVFQKNQQLSIKGLLIIKKSVKKDIPHLGNTVRMNIREILLGFSCKNRLLQFFVYLEQLNFSTTFFIQNSVNIIIFLFNTIYMLHVLDSQKLKKKYTNIRKKKNFFIIDISFICCLPGLVGLSRKTFEDGNNKTCLKLHRF